jgi:hypothetical protein
MRAPHLVRHSPPPHLPVRVHFAFKHHVPGIPDDHHPERGLRHAWSRTPQRAFHFGGQPSREGQIAHRMYRPGPLVLVGFVSSAKRRFAGISHRPHSFKSQVRLGRSSILLPSTPPREDARSAPHLVLAPCQLYGPNIHSYIAPFLACQAQFADILLEIRRHPIAPPQRRSITLRVACGARLKLRS